MLGIVLGDALTGRSSFLVPLARLTVVMAPALPTSAAFCNLARLGVVSVHTLAVVIQQSQVVDRLGSLKSILRAFEITEEELLETAFQPVTLSRFFWGCTRSAPVSSGTQDSLPDPKAEKPVQWINADVLAAEKGLSLKKQLNVD